MKSGFNELRIKVFFLCCEPNWTFEHTAASNRSEPVLPDAAACMSVGFHFERLEIFAETVRTYAILDAAKAPGLPELLAASELEHRCLFKGDTYEELKDVAPWIV